MLLLLPIYTKIHNSDYKIPPSVLKTIIDEEKNKHDLTPDELNILEIVFSFYTLGYENHSKSKQPVSP